MRKNILKFLALAALALTCHQAQGQRSRFSLGGGLGPVQEGFGGITLFGHYHNRTDFLQASLLVSFSKDKASGPHEIPYREVILGLGYFTPVYASPNRGLMVYIGGGPSLGHESVNNGEEELEDGSLLLSKSGVVYGLHSGLGIEQYLSDQVSLVLPANFYYNFNSDLGTVHLFLGIGLRYFFNQ